MPLRLRFARRTTLYIFFSSIGEDAAARRRGAPDRRPVAVERSGVDPGRIRSLRSLIRRGPFCRSKKISPAMPVALLQGYEAATRAPVLADVTAAATTRATHAMPQTNPNRRSSVRSGSGWSTASATDPVPQVWTGRSSSNSAPRNCTEARAMGLENIPRGSPYYASWLDRDNDGLACEPWHGGRR
jgi:hypothetical protein